MEDPKRKLVYDWEDMWPLWDRNTLTLAACRKLIRWACQKYGVEPPRVTQHHKRSLSYYDPDEGLISLQAVGPDNKGGKNNATALHEAAHHIVWKTFGERVQDHGPTFMGILMWLLIEAKVAPRAALIATAAEKRLTWRKLPPECVRHAAVPG